MALTDPSRHLVNRRTVLLAGLMSLPVPIFLSRLFYLQNVEGQQYRLLAEKNKVRGRLMQPQRGRLLDRTGKVIAEDEQVYRLVLIPEQTPDIPTILKKLSNIVNLTTSRLTWILKEASSVSSFTPVTVLHTLPFNELAKVQVNLPDLPGLDFVPLPLRRYTTPEQIGHLVGYVGRLPKNQKLPTERWMPDFPVGRRGLEKHLEDKLRGVAGIRQIELNAHGREVREVNRISSQQGEDIRISVDLEAQQVATKALGKNIGAVSAIELSTGRIVVASNKPGLNANLFAEGMDEATWQGLLTDPNKPLINRAFQGLYAPGSTIKPIIALAALEEGVADPEETFYCKGHTQFGDRRFHCWDKHGRVNMHKSIARSCDIYFYEMGKRLGVNTMAKYFRMFGLGEGNDFGIPAKSGLVPTKEWKLKNKGERWAGGEDLITAIGQGFLLATPVQLATATARLATGRMVQPTLDGNANPQDFPLLDVNPENLKRAQEGMHAVVHDPVLGTAKSIGYKAKFKIGGKTGTAQVISKRFEKDTPTSSIPYASRAHALFVAFGPYESPRYAVSAIVEHGASGSRAAAPVAQKVLQHLLEKELLNDHT